MSDPFIVLFASMAFAQLSAAALGDQPFGRYWDPAVPFFILMLVFVSGDLARRVRNGSTRLRTRTAPAQA
jgi:hypothetical protein